ncbi:MAG: hypothetical protein ABI637_03520 [Gemmatimonadota bacterium]
MLPRSLWSLILFATGAAAPLAAQQWNAPPALELVRRAVERRVTAQADTSLASYRTRAHGFVLFLAQVGQEGLAQAPHLVKGDELDVEVYWKAPNRSKQVILGWRDGTFLPTDINYHRDHLGIVTNNFGNVIRIGEGDEVRDAIHPLSPAGLALYDFEIQDSLIIRTGAETLVLRAVAVRPKAFNRPAVVGTLYLNEATAEMVRFRFSFTPASYLDSDLEDINITLENALVEGRYWLPYRQEVEIRRRTSWLDLPARGIIRGRWEIGEYDMNVAFPESTLEGPAIAGLRRPNNADTTWKGSLLSAIDSIAEPLNQQDMAALRVEVERIAGAHLMSGLPSRRLAIGSVSDLIHVNRVQGLALGAGATIGVSRSRLELRPSIGVGTSDWRATGGLDVSVGTRATRVFASGERSISDFSDFGVIAPALNSISAQEFGKDYGDYVLLDAGTVGIRHRLNGRTSVATTFAIERSRSVDVAATPATGTYRLNPPLGAGIYRIGRLRLERAGTGIAVKSEFAGAASVEFGDGPTRYLRGSLEGRFARALGPGQLVTRVYGGAGGDGLPAYRSFVVGGRGTLLGEPFRAYGGRRMALAQLEWRFDVPAPAIPLGSFASTGHSMTLAPFVAAGWADRPNAGMPWTASGGIRPVAGLALEMFMRIIRIEAGVGLRTGTAGITIDINRAWWGIL